LPNKTSLFSFHIFYFLSSGLKVLISQFSWFLFFSGAKSAYHHPSVSLSIHLHQRESHLVNFL